MLLGNVYPARLMPDWTLAVLCAMMVFTYHSKEVSDET